MAPTNHKNVSEYSWSNFSQSKISEEQDFGNFLATLIIHGPRLSAGFGPAIQYPLKPWIMGPGYDCGRVRAYLVNWLHWTILGTLFIYVLSKVASKNSNFCKFGQILVPAFDHDKQ